MTGKGFFRYAGIDPGSRTGLVIIDIDPPIQGQPVGPERCRLRFAGSYSASTSKELSGAEQDATLFDRLCNSMVVWQPDVVVLEEPADIGTAWRGGKGRQGRSSAFGIGKAYGLALAAVSNPGGVTPLLYSYLCKGYEDRGAKTITRGDGKTFQRRAHLPREGWMPRQGVGGFKGNAIMSHENQVLYHSARAQEVRDWRNADARGPSGLLHPGTLSEHELFALAVLLYHLDKPNMDRTE